MFTGSEDLDVSTPTSLIPPVNTSVPPPGMFHFQQFHAMLRA